MSNRYDVEEGEKKKEKNLTTIFNKAGKIGGSAIENLSQLRLKPKKKVQFVKKQKKKKKTL